MLVHTVFMSDSRSPLPISTRTSVVLQNLFVYTIQLQSLLESDSKTPFWVANLCFQYVYVQKKEGEFHTGYVVMHGGDWGKER